MNALDTQTRMQYEKIANMMLFGIAQTDIAAAVCLSEGRISQIKETEEYKQIYAAQSADHYERAQLVNQGWDALEEVAVAKLIETMEYNRDPDFALRVAAMSNKAVRRGSAGNKPIQAAAVGTQVIVNLNSAYVDRVQELKIDTSKPNAEIPRKQRNMMSPARVEAFLNGDKPGAGMAEIAIDAQKIADARIDDDITFEQLDDLINVAAE